MIAIVAKSANDVIGHKGKLPWHCSEDLALFKRLTTGKTIVVGRKTFTHLPVLPGRNILVLSRHGLPITGGTVINFISEIPEDAIVCGGAEVYNLLIDKCDELLVSVINQTVTGDVMFNYDWLKGFVMKDTVFSSTSCTMYRYGRECESP